MDDAPEARVPMSFAKEIIASAMGDDKYAKKLGEAVQRAAERRLAYMRVREEIKEVLDAFEVLGASIDVSADCQINVRIAGDKECFVKCWKLWRSVDVRLSPPASGATEVYEVIEPRGVSVWFHFSSTVCKRVQVGTKMVETPIFETHCGEPIEIPKVDHDDLS
jgi:hypothetical protein